MREDPPGWARSIEGPTLLMGREHCEGLTLRMGRGSTVREDPLDGQEHWVRRTLDGKGLLETG